MAFRGIAFKQKCALLRRSIKYEGAKKSSSAKFNEPKSGMDMARAGGIASAMRLPIADSTKDLDAFFVGVPIDNGTSNRSGTRFGPRQIRSESALVRKFNVATGADPYSSMQVADVGDVWVNPYNLEDCCNKITSQYKELIHGGAIPLTMGGDHTISYPILRAVADKYGPVAMVHVDAHGDCNDKMLGEKIAHGTPFRRAVEDNLLCCDKVVQIGLRGSGYSTEDHKYQIDQGFRVVPAEDCWHKSLSPIMEEIRKQIGDTPMYLSFDIDALDPSFAPGTGTPEIAGLSTIQALEIIQGCRGLNIVGCDLVEVSPPYDATGTTALVAANLLFEMLCVLPSVKYHKLYHKK